VTSTRSIVSAVRWQSSGLFRTLGALVVVALAGCAPAPAPIPTPQTPVAPPIAAPAPPTFVGAWKCVPFTARDVAFQNDCQYRAIAGGRLRYEVHFHSGGSYADYYRSWTIEHDAKGDTLHTVDALGRDHVMGIVWVSTDHVRWVDENGGALLELVRIDPKELWDYLANDQE